MHLYTCEILGCMAAIAALELIVKNADFDKKKNFNADAKYVLEKVGLPCYPGGGYQISHCPVLGAPRHADERGEIAKIHRSSDAGAADPRPTRESFVATPPIVITISHQACSSPTSTKSSLDPPTFRRLPSSMVLLISLARLHVVPSFPSLLGGRLIFGWGLCLFFRERVAAGG